MSCRYQEKPSALKETLVELNLEQHPPRTWEIITEITAEFILGVDVLCAHNASIDLRQQVL
jgi:hypothetical protein